MKISLVAANNFGKYVMEIKVNFLDNLRLEAKFDDFSVIADQPIRYKGDGSAPGPFDYFLASSALCGPSAKAAGSCSPGTSKALHGRFHL